MTNAQHVFERAGLGLAPYKFLGMEEKRGPIVTELGGGIRQMVGSPGQPMGCCQYCSTGIAYCYWLQSADGKKFYVGSECILKSGDAGLRKVVKDEQKKQRATKREATRKQQREAREKARKAEIEARRPAFEAEHGALLQRAERWMAEPFVRDVVTKGRQWASLTPAQAIRLAVTINDLEARERAQQSSRFVGTVGQRIEALVTVTNVGKFSRSVYMMPHLEETVWVITMTDVFGNQFVSKSPNFKRERDEKFTVRGTVKDHSEYRGVKQTVLTRCSTK